MTPLRQRLRRLLSDTRCAAPVTADGGVLRCVSTAGPSGVCDDHLAWRSFRIPMRILFGFKPWWPNELGRLLDRGVPVDVDQNTGTRFVPADPCFCRTVPSIGGGGCGRDGCPLGPSLSASAAAARAMGFFS